MPSRLLKLFLPSNQAECMVMLLLVSQSVSQDQIGEQPALISDCFKVLEQEHTTEIEPSTEPTGRVLEQKNVADDYEFSYEMDDDNGSTPFIVEGTWTALTRYRWMDPNGCRYFITLMRDAKGSKVQLKLRDGYITFGGRKPRPPVISTGALKSLLEANEFRLPSPGERIKFKKMTRKRHS